MSATNSKLVIGGETYLTAKQTAALVGFPYRQLWTRQSRGTLPSPDVNLGHKPLWKEQTVIDWLDKREKAHD